LLQMQARSAVIYEELDVLPEVLVIGCGTEGAAVALAVSENQPVTVIDHDTPHDSLSLLKGKSNITVKTGVKVVGLEGFPGQFIVRFLENGKHAKKSFGAIIVALEAQPRFDTKKYNGLELGERILSLSQFSKKENDYSGQKVTFILGQADQDSLISYKNALSMAIALQEKEADVSILYDDMKVSADQLEQDYELARARGVNFLKYKGDLQFIKTDVAATVRYWEPFLPQSEQIRLISDYLVLAEDYIPHPDTADLADALDVRTGPDGFFQEDNVHFLPIMSNREGIYFIGNCHGPIYSAELEKEVETVKAEVGRFATGKISVAALQPQVTAEQCAVCLTCYRCCPHHAIEIIHDESLNNMYHSAARMNPLACRRCGICAAECPGKAIQLPYYTDKEILQQLSKPPKIVAYACENSGTLAAELANKMEPELNAIIQIVPVPCSGKIDALYLLKALEQGADGVLIIACQKENCKFIRGNVRADQRKELVRKRLEEIGMEGDRIEIVHVAANQGHQFNESIRSMVARINQLGTYPGKVIR
jgi:quinone-modifying oxidoreductase subunit QmoB